MIVAASPHAGQRAPDAADFDIAALRALSVRLLERMYVPSERVFVFRLRRQADASVLPEGRSRRYTAIVLIGLATESADVARSIFAGGSAASVCDRLIDDLPRMDNLGDAALTLWAAAASGHSGVSAAVARVLEFDPAHRTHPTVELAWALTGLCVLDDAQFKPVRDTLARRLLGSFGRQSLVFPHVIGRVSWLRSHVCCFADLVYPVQALAHYHRRTGDAEALEAARRCADHFCTLQGTAGQWWWHYDVRTGRVMEGYPVYSVHQDSMGPMALLAVQDECDADYGEPIRRGLDWMIRCPELGGQSIIEPANDILWRKVARREPRKLARRLQAMAGRVHSSLRFPGIDLAFPAGAIDYEIRPYHLGWVLHAFPADRCGLWRASGASAHGHMERQ